MSPEGGAEHPALDFVRLQLKDLDLVHISRRPPQVSGQSCREPVLGDLCGSLRDSAWKRRARGHVFFIIEYINYSETSIVIRVISGTVLSSP